LATEPVLKTVECNSLGGSTPPPSVGYKFQMKHILFTLTGCNSELLDDEGFVRDVVFAAARVCKSTLLALNSHKFEPQGVTCVAMLAESHISIHTWPENQMAVCDVFTCGDHTVPEDAVEYMKTEFESKGILQKMVDRRLDKNPSFCYDS
jgi:S-adenosylmethionine decarboxylase